MKMKVPFNKLVLASCFAFIVLFLSRCTKSDKGGSSTSNYTINDIMKSSSNATVLYRAMVKSGMDTVLEAPGPYTFFAPTDSAFLASGITASTVDATPAATIRDLLLYHTIAGTAMSRNAFPAGPAAKLVMANGDSVFITNGISGFFVNGVPVRQADIVASNGLIQGLTASCLLPPRGSIYSSILADTNFTLLAAAINRASQGTYNIQAMLSTNGPYTFLAPLDSAFVNAGYTSVSVINGLSPDNLGNLLLGHMIIDRQFTCDLLPNKPLTTAAAGKYVTFQIGANYYQAVGQVNSTPANVLNANIMARNGILFVIDHLITP
jgi:uncharacterized surface protein with fasciclin (FAS1) repeats